jgi:hypothetical protein
MDALDEFSLTIQPAAAQAGVETSAVSRHLSIFHRCVGRLDPPVLVARCSSADPCPNTKRHRRHRRDMLLLTRHRLVVTAKSGLLRRLRLYLNCDLRDLADVNWVPEPELGGVRLAATAVDGVREHFWLDAGGPDAVSRLDALLRQVFAPVPAAA